MWRQPCISVVPSACLLGLAVQGSARTDAQILAGIARVLRGTSLPALHEEERPALADEEDEEDEQGAGAP